MTLPDLLGSAVSSRPVQPALECGGRTYTFTDIDRRSARVAQWLHMRGFRPGDRLAAYLENRVEFIDLFLACAKAGVIFLPINILYRGREVSHIVSDARPKAIVASAPVPEQPSFVDVAEIAAVAEENEAGSTFPRKVLPAFFYFPIFTNTTPWRGTMARSSFVTRPRSF